MRLTTLWRPVLACIGLLCLLQVAHGLVIGIDLGADSFKIVMVRPGSIDIVLNDGSGRKTASAVGYSPHGRMFGDLAQQLHTKNPTLVFNAMTQVLGRGVLSADDAWIHDLEKGDHHLYWLKNATVSEELLPAMEGEPALKRLLVKVGDEIVYTEEVLSQLLTKARQFSSAEAGAPVKDCVITVPYHWSHAQRQSLLDAAHLAGFNVLSLLNQNMAIALKFMTDRDFDTGPQHVVFYDMGTSDLQVSLYRFESQKGRGKTKWANNATLLATAGDISLGGTAFDSAIVAMWVDKLKAKFGSNFELPPQAMTKLQKQAKKTKEILSANKESHATIESLLPDYDFRATITRDEFEKATESLVERAVAPLKSVLEAANLTPQQLDLFEMFGGGARIPKVQDALKAYIQPLQLSRHLNTDEAAAFGAAIFAASKSSQHRVKEFHAKDGSNAHYPILLKATDAAGKSLVEDSDPSTDIGELDRVLYKSTSRLGSRRTLKIKTDKDIYVELKYPSSVQFEAGLTHLIARYKISPPKDMSTRYNITDTPTALIRFELTSSGTVLLTSAENQVPIVTQKVVKIKPPTPAETPASTTETTDAEPSTEEKATEEESEPKEVEEAAASEAAEETPAAEEVVEEQTEIREIRSVVPIKMTVEVLASHGLSDAQLEAAKQRLKVIDDAEKLRLDTEHAKSDLEALIYNIYDKIEDSETKKHSTEAERTSITELLAENSNWLEGEGDNALKAEYLDRKTKINVLWNKIKLRITEEREIPEAVKKCESSIALAREALVKIEETRNVTQSDIDGATESINKVEEFINGVSKAESERAPHEDPPTLSTQVNMRCREFSWRIEFLSKRPRKVKPVEPKPEPEAPADPAPEPAPESDSEAPKEEL